MRGGERNRESVLDGRDVMLSRRASNKCAAFGHKEFKWGRGKADEEEEEERVGHHAERAHMSISVGLRNLDRRVGIISFLLDLFLFPSLSH